MSESALFSRRDHPEVRPVAAGARVGSAVSCVAFPDVCVPPSACDNPPDEEHSRVLPLAITIRLCEHPRTGFCASTVSRPQKHAQESRGAGARQPGGAGGPLEPWTPRPSLVPVLHLFTSRNSNTWAERQSQRQSAAPVPCLLGGGRPGAWTCAPGCTRPHKAS